MLQQSDFESQILLNLHNYVQQSNDPTPFLVQLIEQAGGYLNLMTIPDYSNQSKISYNGVKKCRKIQKIFNVKFVIDNE